MVKLPVAVSTLVVAGWTSVMLSFTPSAVASVETTPDDIGALRVDDLEPRATFGYHKGRRVKVTVVTIGWADVEVRTARAFLAMRAAAARDGVELWIRNGFRSHEHQEWLYQAWKAGWGNRAARPGHSNHQNGRALDLHLVSPATFIWLESNARRFGFRRTVKGEPWHWEFFKKKTRRATARRR